MDMSVSVTLSPSASYKPVEVVMQRKFRGKQEYFVKWVLFEDKPTNTTDALKKSRDGFNNEYCVWMRMEEVKACCPQLLATDIRPLGESSKENKAASESQPVVDDEPLLEMMSDVRTLISRAKRLFTQPSAANTKILSSTLNILSAYASIGALAHTFRENGALDLLLSLLSSQDATVHKSSSSMLRSLMTFDLSSRAYVMRQLSEIDSAMSTSVEGQKMLLDLFAETASTGEGEYLLKGLTLPQVPGRFIFSLLKKYLWVNSITSSSPAYEVSSAVVCPKGKLSVEFEKFYALDQLISELFTFFGWFEGSTDSEGRLESGKVMKGVSIFAGTLPTEQKPPKEKINPYKSRDDFISDREYGRYVKATLKPGMKVRARVMYESVAMGDYGVYLQTNDGTPPAQFQWEGLGDTYWVYWHQVDLLPDEKDEKGSDSDSVKSPPRSAGNRQPYVMRALALPSGWSQQGSQKCNEKVERLLWWEILCVLKSQAEELVKDVVEILDDKGEMRFDDLVRYTPDYSQVGKVLELLQSNHTHISQEPLTIREKPIFRELFNTDVDRIHSTSEENIFDDELGSNYRKEAPFPDPYHEEVHVHIPPALEFEGHPFSTMLSFRKRKEFPDAMMQLKFLEHSQDGTNQTLMSAKETIEKILTKAPNNISVALQGIKIVKSSCEKLRRDTERQEMCVSGFLSFILKLMRFSLRSYTLQVAGVECFFKLVGGYGVDPLYAHLEKSVKDPEIVSSTTRSVIVTLMASLAAASQPAMKTFVEGLRCLVDYFHTHMPRTQLRTSLSTICGGLIVLSLLIKEKEVLSKFDSWGVPDLLKAIITDLPTFPGKRDLLLKINHVMDNAEIASMLDSSKEQDEEVKIMTREVVLVIKVLRNLDEVKGKNPLVRLVSLLNNKTELYKSKLVELNSTFVSMFLQHHGVFYLCQALEVNNSDGFVEHTITVICSLIEYSEESAAQVVLQGGLRAIVNILSSNPSDRHKHTMCLQAVERLAKDPDYVSVMAAENISTPLNNAKDKFTDKVLADMVVSLADLCESEESSRASVNQKILRIIFSGILQQFLAAIEDARRESEPVNLPRFSAFIKYLSTGSGGAVSALQEQWWDGIEVSSNSQNKEHLLDGSQATHWESTGRSGTHWIRLHMKKGLIIKKMYLEVSSDKPNFMPQKVSVHGGSTADNAQEISNVYIPATFNGGYEIVTNAKKYYAVVIIRVKRCQLGGVDCRIRGIKCQATTTSLWPLFGDIFSARSKLYYQIQFQTWLKSNLGPLELFDKLSAVILYEQMFGDSYLHTVQSRQCIGQACRSALVTPLIETITSPTDSGGPDLGALIHEYIAQMQTPLASHWRALASSLAGGKSLDVGVASDMDIYPQELSDDPLEFTKAQKRLVKMSQIRRICRLMVDWDDGPKRPAPPPSRSDDEPPPRPVIKPVVYLFDGTKIGADEVAEAAEKAKEEREEEERKVVLGSGTIALAKCWRTIVESQVSMVLKKFNLDSPYQVAADLLSIYDRLKQAMLELFGGHSQFALSLKGGFSRAFQGLDEVTGVRFCELLCLCIDSLMDSAGKDSTKLHHLGESQREKMLLHFAEPLQFLHGLDLAHIFEHYYKQHLSSRIIRGRSISLLLERRLSQTFAHCFPHKSPQQMLEDLESSQALMDRFCDSELLESLDQLMVQASQQDMLPQEIVSLSHKCKLYRERLFQVYTLNPCFWPIRQRQLPMSCLPPTLAQFCDDFTKFFSSAHECGLQQHERPRRLQFTFQGWAVLQFEGAKLVVSTVQMCVLLQFITTNTHSLQSLQEATHLSYQDICDALLSLTSEKQAVLVTAPGPSETTPTCDEELHLALQSSPFKITTMFKVNDKFVRDVLPKHKSNKVRVHDVQLVPRGQSSVPSRQDRSVDLAHVFERRRAVMDSAIVRILKKEKQMSVDNIAHKVIKGCSAGRFDRGASFGRFDCDYRDICSRIDRLIVSGYIKRDMSNRQMLVYVPDPSTSAADAQSVDMTPEDLPQTRLTDATSTKVTDEPGPFTSTAGPVAATSSTSAPKASSRKRSGVGRQPQSKTKRKPTSSTRIYANEVFEQHEPPQLGMLPTSHSLGPSDVQARINSLLHKLSPVLKLEIDDLEHLLHHFKWNTDKLMQKYLTDSSAIMKEVGLTGSPGSSPPLQRQDVTCPVCTLHVSSEELMWLWCNHGCCKSCWQNHLLTQIDLNRALLCSCPVFACPARPSRSFFVKAFGADTDPINKFSKAIVHSYVQQSSWLTWCRNPLGCTQVLCRGDGMDTGTCHTCLWSSCFSCTFMESHQPATCEDIQKWVDIGGFYVGMDEDAKSKQLANIIAKKCPNCSAQIEKDEGCLHMKCKCGHNFCWKCLKPWKSHTDYFNCSAKVSKAARDHKKFQDFNDLCTAHHRSKCFAEKLCVIVKRINASVPIKTLSFLSDACDLLVQCHKMLMYTYVAEFFSKLDTSGYLGFLSESLEGDTNTLQAFLENTLLSTTTDVARAISTLTERKLQDGYCLVSKIENTRDKLLVGAQQQFKLGEINELGSPSEDDEDEDEDQSSRALDFDGYSIEDEDDYDDYDDLYGYSDYEDSYHDAFDSWDDGFDYEDMFPYS